MSIEQFEIECGLRDPDEKLSETQLRQKVKANSKTLQPLLHVRSRIFFTQSNISRHLMFDYTCGPSKALNLST